MKILVDHGAHANIGDVSIIEGAVLRLVNLLPEDEIYVIDRPSLRTKIWDLPKVFRQKEFSVKTVWGDLMANVPFLWHYSEYWKRIILKLSLLSMRNLFSENSFYACYNENTKAKPMAFTELCEQFNALHIVGGGYMTDIFCNNLFRKLILIQSFRKQNKPVILTGQQLGPFRSIVFKEALVKTLQKISFVGLRDPSDSLTFCQEACLKPRSFDVMGDDSFGLPPANDQLILDILGQFGIKENRFLAFNIRIAPYAKEHAKHLRQISMIVDKLSEQFQMPVVIIPTALNPNDNDINSGKKLANLTQNANILILNNNNLRPALVKGIMGKAFGAVGVSYHFCIFALIQGVPAVCIYDGNYYSQKARGLCGFWKDKRLALSLGGIDTRLAIDHIMQVFDDQLLREKLKHFSKQAIECWKHIFDSQIDNYLG